MMLKKILSSPFNISQQPPPPSTKTIFVLAEQSNRDRNTMEVNDGRAFVYTHMVELDTGVGLRDALAKALSNNPNLINTYLRFCIIDTKDISQLKDGSMYIKSGDNHTYKGEPLSVKTSNLAQNNFERDIRAGKYGNIHS